MEAASSEVTLGVVFVALVIIVFASRFPQYVLPMTGGASVVLGVVAIAKAPGAIQEITVVLLILGGLLLIGVGQGIRWLGNIAEALKGADQSPEPAKSIDPGGPERAGQRAPGHGI